MDKHLQRTHLEIASNAWATVGLAKQRAAAKAALFADGAVPTKEVVVKFDAESQRLYRAATDIQEQRIEAAKAAAPPPHKFRGKDAAAEARIAGIVQESLHLTPAGLGALLRETAADAAAGDEDAYALNDRLLRVNGPGGRIDYAKVLTGNPGLFSNRVVEAQQRQDAHPAVRARAEYLEQLTLIEQEVNLLYKIVSSPKPLDAIDAYLRTNALPNILPLQEGE